MNSSVYLQYGDKIQKLQKVNSQVKLRPFLEKTQDSTINFPQDIQSQQIAGYWIQI